MPILTVEYFLHLRPHHTHQFLPAFPSGRETRYVNRREYPDLHRARPKRLRIPGHYVETARNDHRHYGDACQHGDKESAFLEGEEFPFRPPSAFGSDHNRWSLPYFTHDLLDFFRIPLGAVPGDEIVT